MSIQLQNIILGLQANNTLVYDHNTQSFYNYGNAKPREDQVTETAQLMKAIADFIRKKQFFEKEQKDDLRIVLTKKLIPIQHKLYTLHGFLGSIFNFSNRKKLQEEENEIESVLRELNHLSNISERPITSQQLTEQHNQTMTSQEKRDETEELEEKKELLPRALSGEFDSESNSQSSMPSTPSNSTIPPSPPTSSFSLHNSAVGSHFFTPLKPGEPKILSFMTPSTLLVKPRTTDLDIPAPPPLETFSVLSFKNEPAPLKFDSGPLGYASQPTGVINEQIKLIEEFIQSMQNAIEPIKQIIEEYEKLKGDLETAKKHYDDLNEEKKRHETNLFTIQLIEHDNVTRLFRYNSKIIPIFSSTIYDRIKQRHKQLEQEKETKIKSLHNVISGLETSIANSSDSDTDKLKELNQKLENSKKELEGINKEPSFNIGNLFPSLTVKSAKECLKYILDNFSEWKQDEATNCANEIEKLQAQINKLEKISNNNITFKDFKEIYDKKVKEIVKWKRCKESRQKHIDNIKPKSFQITPPSSSSNQTSKLEEEFSKLEEEFPELKYLSKLEQERIVLGKNPKEEGIWQNVSCVEK